MSCVSAPNAHTRRQAARQRAADPGRRGWLSARQADARGRHAPAEHPEDVHDGQHVGLHSAHVDDGEDERHVLQRDVLAQKAHHDERREDDEQRDVEGLLAHMLEQRRRRFLFLVAEVPRGRVGRLAGGGLVGRRLSARRNAEQKSAEQQRAQRVHAAACE
jgi:hypothetical protein